VAVLRRNEIDEELRRIEDHDAQKILVVENWVRLRDPRPISVNAAYTRARGMVFLSKEGKVFEDALRAEVSQTLMHSQVPWGQVVDLVYKQGGSLALEIWLYTDMLNGAWKVGGGTTSGGKTGKPQPRSPYKKMDASNYIKLIEDAVVKGSGVDDSANLDVTICKRHDPVDPRIVIRYRGFE